MSGYIGTKASVVTPGAERKKIFAITGATTSLTGLVYTPGFVHVYHNGVRLVDGTDYTATNGTSITLTTAAQSGDEVVVISYATFQTSDTVSASAGGTFSNAVTIDADGATVLTVDRATSDGTIIDLQKDGSSVGSIGIDGGYLTFDNSAVKLGKSETGQLLLLTATETATPRLAPVTDNAVNVGNTTTRFKDLYLSGGVYLGGTGSANYLDDYETGTWTPIVADVGSGASYNAGTYSSGTNTYVKIGNVVHLFFELNNIDTTGMTGGNDIFVRNVPFTSHSSNGTNYYGTVRTSSVSYQTDANIALQMNNSDSHFRVVESRNGLTADFILVSQVSSGSGDIHGTLIYETDL